MNVIFTSTVLCALPEKSHRNTHHHNTHTHIWSVSAHVPVQTSNNPSNKRHNTACDIQMSFQWLCVYFVSLHWKILSRVLTCIKHTVTENQSRQVHVHLWVNCPFKKLCKARDLECFSGVFRASCCYYYFIAYTSSDSVSRTEQVLMIERIKLHMQDMTSDWTSWTHHTASALSWRHATSNHTRTRPHHISGQNHNNKGLFTPRMLTIMLNPLLHTNWLVI